jgi:hypothetical protein
MPRPKKDSSYRQAIDSLRSKHSDKIEEVFLTMYGISQNPEAEDRDKVNAAKVCVSLLGVPRAGIEKPPEKQKSAAETKIENKPTKEELDIIEARLNA